MKIFKFFNWVLVLPILLTTSISSHAFLYLPEEMVVRGALDLGSGAIKIQVFMVAFKDNLIIGQPLINQMVPVSSQSIP